MKKRIKLAELLHARAEGFGGGQECPILIVDHDLAVLDYASDMVHLFYGTPHQFGIVSGVMTTKKGINAYLDGYLKTENIQFREKKIGFKGNASGRQWSTAKIFAEYGRITKTFDTFHLEIEPGLIYATEILCIVGENGCGKSTFAKILAGDFRRTLDATCQRKGQAFPINLSILRAIPTKPLRNSSWNGPRITIFPRK